MICVIKLGVDVGKFVEGHEKHGHDGVDNAGKVISSISVMRSKYYEES